MEPLPADPRRILSRGGLRMSEIGGLFLFIYGFACGYVLAYVLWVRGNL